MNVVATIENVQFLPMPNRVEVVLTPELSPIELTSTAFVVPVFPNGDVMLANNQRRGPEIAGGHIEIGEDAATAAIREALEETGCIVEDMIPLGYLRMTSEGEVPDNWKYPHPVGYQQFFAARCVSSVEFKETDECALPILVQCLDELAHSRPLVKIFVMAARQAVMGDHAP